MEEELAAAKCKLLEEEKELEKLVQERDKIRQEFKAGGETDSKLRKAVREKDHCILVKEGDIVLTKKRVKQLTYKIEIVSKMSEIELEDDINDLKNLLEGVGKRLKKNQELAVETFDKMIDMHEKGKELAKGIEESRQKAMGECDVRTDKLQARLDARQDFVDQKKAEIREIRRASGIPDPEELAEIRRLAALNQGAASGDN